MHVPKIAERLALVLVFCGMLGGLHTLIVYSEAKISSHSVLHTLRFFQNTPYAYHAQVPQALFDGKIIKKTILGLIDKTQPRDTISMTAFIITDNDIVDALVKKHTQGTKIVVITDPQQTAKECSKTPLLVKAGIPVYLHNSSTEGIMHNKFTIFNFTREKPVVITGSYNYTHSASTKNAENIVLIDHAETIQEFTAHFEKLLKSSLRVKVPEVKKRGSKVTDAVINSILKYSSHGLPTYHVYGK